MTRRPETGIEPGAGNPELPESQAAQAPQRVNFVPRLSHHASRITHHASPAFTLLEVMIAMGIFFMATFAILAMVSSTLRNARALQNVDVDASSFAAVLSATNKLYEGRYDLGAFHELEEVYKDCTGWADCQEVGTNGLFELDLTIQHGKGGRGGATTMSILLFRPESPASRFGPTLR